MLLQTIGIFNEGIQLDILREDLRHPFISGNKWWKLKHNIAEAKRWNCEIIVTFGGAYSNHLAATSAAGNEAGIATAGIVRGEDDVHNATLQFCRRQGMQLYFVSREEYRLKNFKRFNFNNAFVVPEGGSNDLGVKGCAEMGVGLKESYDFVVCACGTGATLSGLIVSARQGQKILGVPVLKGAEFLKNDIQGHLLSQDCDNTNWDLLCDYHCGGYGKISNELVVFIKMCAEKYKIPLDGIYTGKMAMAAFDLLQKRYFPPHSKVLLVHTGGLQGNAGILQRFGVDLTASC